MSIEDMVKVKLTKKESELFGEWAFGEKFKSFEHGPDFMTAWNERHSNEVKLYEDGCIALDMLDMVELWRKHLTLNI